MDACEVFAICTVGVLLRIAIPVLVIIGIGWVLGRIYKKRNGKPKP